MRGDGRRWLREAAARREVMSLLGGLVTLSLTRSAFLHRKFDPDQPRDAIGRWVDVGAGSDLAGSTVVVNRAITGNTKIDDTTDLLMTKLSEAIEKMEDGQEHGHGTLVHAEFARAVRASNVPGLEVERSFKLGELVPYGLGGSVRTDVILRDQFGEISAVWDVKTGSAVLSTTRADELRRQLKLDSDVPVIQLHHYSGSSFKAQIVWGT